jgi:hypothetical protein
VVDLVLPNPVFAVHQILVHSDRFFDNNQTVIDHAKITWFWAMENNQVRRFPHFTVFGEHLEFLVE